MAAGIVQLADVIVPTPFTKYTSFRTRELTDFVRSGIMRPSAEVKEFLLGGGASITRPSWKDLDDTAMRVSTDANSPLYTAGFGTAFPAPEKIGSYSETMVRLNRNQHWAATELAGQLAGDDAFTEIGDKVAAYLARQLQETVLAILAGLFADNDAAVNGADTHTQGDLTFDVSQLAGGAFQAGLTNFTAEGFFDALQTAGDAKKQFKILATHSAVHNRMKKNNLIDFVPDSLKNAGDLDTFQGMPIVVDDGMPSPQSGLAAGIYHTYIFTPGFLEWDDSVSGRMVPTELVHRPEAGNGGGSDELWRRIQWCIHPTGTSFIGTPPATGGGPGNGTGANQLANAASWGRRVPERKAVGIARYITKEL